MLLGLRREEIGTIEWDWVDFENRVLNIPNSQGRDPSHGSFVGSLHRDPPERPPHPQADLGIRHNVILVSGQA